MSTPQFSPRQAEVCGLVANGDSDKAIAAVMHIKVRMVRQHMEDAARRIRQAQPKIPGGSPRKVILRYYAACVAIQGVIAFEHRRQARLEQREAA